MKNNISKFNYKNVEIKTQSGGKKIVRKVSIKNGKGYKSITKYNKGKRIGSIKKIIDGANIELIKLGKFIPGLFSDCTNCKNTTRKNR